MSVNKSINITKKTAMSFVSKDAAIGVVSSQHHKDNQKGDCTGKVRKHFDSSKGQSAQILKTCMKSRDLPVNV